MGMVSVGIRRYPQVSVTLGISKYLIFCRIPAFCKCNLSLFIILIKWSDEFHSIFAPNKQYIRGKVFCIGEVTCAEVSALWWKGIHTFGTKSGVPG